MSRCLVFPREAETLGTLRQCAVCGVTQNREFQKDWDGDFVHDPNCEFAELQTELEQLRAAYEAMGRLVSQQEAGHAAIVEKAAELQQENHTLKNTSKCPVCGGEFAGEGYTNKVHFTCKNCGGHFSLDIEKWNKIVHPKLPETETK